MVRKTPIFKKTITYGGKQYKLDGLFYTIARERERSIRLYSKMMKERGYTIRIVKFPDGWLVYARRK